MNSFFKKIILASFISTFFLSVAMNVFAQESQYPKATAVSPEEERQVLSELNTGNTSSGAASGPASIRAGGVAQGFAGCIASSGVANAVRSAITGLAAGFAGPPTLVPTNDPILGGKETGSVLSGGISWDQMGWCLANSLIEEIGRATVVWINTGFQGNPVFVDDPGQFFADIADVQATMFLNEVTGGALCTPIKDWVRINLVQSYNSQIAGYGQEQCSFDNNALTQFMNGETFSWNDWLNYTQNPNNNPYAATVYGEIALNERITNALGLQQQQLQWSAGFLSKVDPVTKKITSPGTVIEAQVNETLFSGKRRLEIADEFDEVVNALVNQLIRVALSEVTEMSQ